MAVAIPQQVTPYSTATSDKDAVVSGVKSFLNIELRTLFSSGVRYMAFVGKWFHIMSSQLSKFVSGDARPLFLGKLVVCIVRCLILTSHVLYLVSIWVTGFAERTAPVIVSVLFISSYSLLMTGMHCCRLSLARDMPQLTGLRIP
jgi:hypothetical protein